MSTTNTLSAELTDQEAMALAQFCKRVGFCDFRNNAVNDDEAYLMRAAISKIQDDLAEKGFSPR